MGVTDWLRRRLDSAVEERLGDDVGARTRALVFRGNEYGYDAYGLGRDHLKVAALLAGWIYRHYFRAEAHGIENIPAAGRVLFVSNHSGQLPYDGVVIGYATSTPFRPKPAYLHTRESTVYVAPGNQGRGTGRALYDDLLRRLVDDGVHLVVAAVALPNAGSLALHRACGFEEVGTMRQVGRKFDRWIDVTWLQRVLD
jgi:phosphinothricin acetyltransferase